jgi:lysozyme
MTPQEFTAEVERRIGIDEGSAARVYLDSMGIPTIGKGFNLQRADAAAALAQVGVHDFAGVMAGRVELTPSQIDALFGYSLAPQESNARASLTPGVFDALSDARRFVLLDLEFNLGSRGWLGFPTTRALINEAQAAKIAGKGALAAQLFGIAADHLRISAWDGQVGDRARRDEAMLRTSNWCSPTGDGSDVL